MGKIRTRVIGNEEVEEKQKKAQKEKSAQKKLEKKAAKATSKATEALKEAEKKEKLEAEEGVEQPPKQTKKEEKKEEKAKEKAHVRGKKYRSARKSLDQSKTYTVKTALPLLKKVKFASFDESVELHLNVDQQGLKGEVELPFSTGKTVRVKIVDDALLDKIENGVIEFDVLIAHPSYMAKLAKFARVLGPKGLMPNPKAGTVSPNPEEVAKKFEKGTLRWKTEPKFPLIHQMIGKTSFEEAQLMENAQAFMNAVGKAHIKAAFIKTTMSPSLKLDVEKS
jgi:large subunit ribosomal protein L1